MITLSGGVWSWEDFAERHPVTAAWVDVVEKIFDMGIQIPTVIMDVSITMGDESPTKIYTWTFENKTVRMTSMFVKNTDVDKVYCVTASSVEDAKDIMFRLRLALP